MTATKRLYLQGAYYDLDRITEKQKEEIKLANPNVFTNLAKKYNWQNESNDSRTTAPQRRKKGQTKGNIQ